MTDKEIFERLASLETEMRMLRDDIKNITSIYTNAIRAVLLALLGGIMAFVINGGLVL